MTMLKSLFLQAPSFDGHDVEIVKEIVTSRDMLVRRLREGVVFFQFLKHREDMIVS
jgi:hypothetical protein